MTIPYLEVYGSINNGAHRQAAELVGAPAFIWHQALWKPVSEKKSYNETKRDQDATDQANYLKSYIKAVFDGVGKIPGTECLLYNEIDVEPEDRANVMSFSFNWEKMRVIIRIEIHTEYITITSIIDISIRLFDSLPGDGLVRKVHDYLDKFIKGTCPTPEEPSPKIEEINNVYQFIYHDIWDLHFFPQILNVDGRISEGSIGNKFAEFRGFITCEQYADKQEQENRSTPLFSRIVGMGQSSRKQVQEEEPRLSLEMFVNKLIQEPFYRPEEGGRHQWQQTSVPDSNWARYRLNNVWDFLSIIPKDQPSFLTGRTEFAVSRLLGGRILYVSALGPQPKHRSQGNEQPIYLYLHSVTQCEREIGRTVDRLMQLGTLRLAALIALPHIKKVKQKLEKLERSISIARAKTHLLIQSTKFPKNQKEQYESDLEQQEESILSLLDKIQTMMATLSDGTYPELGGYLGDASLEYRLIRSRYYKSNFFSLLDGLRIQRLEGYQPYNEFIKRRLGSAFGFIEGVEQRIEQIKEDWRALDQLYLTTTVTILTGKIDKQQEETKGIQKKIEEVQLWGEVLLIGVLTPYYMANLFFHLFNCEYTSWCSQSINHHISFGQEITISVWFFALVIATARAIHNREKSKRHKLKSKET